MSARRWQPQAASWSGGATWPRPERPRRYSSGAAFAAIEKTDATGHPMSAWDGVWWAMSTVTTVGYGDYSPRTDGGRAIAIVVMLAGIGFVAVLTAAAADRFMRSSRQAGSELGEVLERLDSIAERLDAIERDRSHSRGRRAQAHRCRHRLSCRFPSCSLRVCGYGRGAGSPGG